MASRTLPVDFAEQYRQYMRRIQYQELPAEEWDRRALAMSRKTLQYSDYATAFLQKMHLDHNQTVLDVGCGPGTLALKMAPEVRQVYCLDYSQGMLGCLMDYASRLNIRNITPMHLSKEDVWDSVVPRCDTVICSRAGLDHDLAAFLQKLNRYARGQVYFSYLVGGRFDQQAIADLLNIQRTPFPDYIYVMNILYQLGIDADLSFVQVSGRLADCTDIDDFLARMQQQYGILSPQQQQLLRLFYQQYHSLFDTAAFGMKWALFNWRVDKL